MAAEQSLARPPPGSEDKPGEDKPRVDKPQELEASCLLLDGVTPAQSSEDPKQTQVWKQLEGAGSLQPPVRSPYLLLPTPW